MSPRLAPLVPTLLGMLLTATCRTPDAGLPTPDAWSPAEDGLQVQLVTDKSLYLSGESIRLTLSCRNRDALPWVIIVGPPKDSSPKAPLYGVSSLTLVRLADERARERRLVVKPVDSQMFWLAEPVQVQPEAVYSSTGALNTWAWEPADRPNPRETPLLRLEPGTYTVSAHYDGHSGSMVAQMRENLEQLRRFFVGPDTSLDAFERARIMGFSYAAAALLRDSGFRLWSGDIDTPAVRFVVAEAPGDDRSPHGN
jgi:hypothetical protein